MAAAAAGLHMATAARRRLSLGYESCVGFFSKPNPLRPSPTSAKISDPCSSSYGFSGNRSIVVMLAAYHSATSTRESASRVCESASSNPSLSAHPNAAMLILKRAFYGSWGPHHSVSHYYRGEPQRIIAPVWQISFTNPEECWRDGVMRLDEFCSTYPIWKEIQQNNLVSWTDNLRVLNDPWMWFLRSLATIASFNHFYGVTAYPSFTKDNVFVSRRFHQAILKNPMGFNLNDPGLKALLNSEQCNGRAFAYHAIGSLFEDLLEEFHPGVPKPLDVDRLLTLMSRDLISLAAEELIVNNPCLMSIPGRIGFTNYAHHLFCNVFPNSTDKMDNITLQDVLCGLAAMRGPDKMTTWEEEVERDLLFSRVFDFGKGGSILIADAMRRACVVKACRQTFSSKAELMVRGSAVLGLHRNGIRHAFDPRYRNDPAIKNLGEYTLDDVVEHQHCKFPLCLPMIGESMLGLRRVDELFLYYFFHVHPEAYKR